MAQFSKNLVIRRLPWLALFGAILLAVSACRTGVLGSGSGSWRPSPHEGGVATVSTAEATGRPDAAGAKSSAAISIYDLAIDVTRVELPVGEIRSSPKIWNHVDVMRLDAAPAASLARNGFRVGVGVPTAWAAIGAIIESAGGRVYRDQVAVPRGQPFVLDLGPVLEGSAVFAFDQAGRLSGRTFEGGRFLLQLDYNYQAGASRSLEVQLSMEVRTDHGVMTWERQGGIIRQVPSIDRHLFAGVRGGVTLNQDEFLILGPDADQTGEYLVGNRCFLHDRNGEPYEIVLFLTPTVVESQGASVDLRAG